MKHKEKAEPEQAEIRFDERQILERGKAFRNGYISLATAMLVCFLIKDCFEMNLVDDSSIMLACLWVSVVVFSVTMIVKNAYDGIHEGRNAVVVSFMGAAGFFILVIESIKGIRGTFVLFSAAGNLICAASMLTICAVYWAKRQRDRKRDNAEEKP